MNCEGVMEQDYLLTDKEVREKLIIRGAGKLSDAELLSLLLPKSDLYDSALEMAMRLLSYFKGSLSAIGACDLKELRKTGNLGLSGALMISVALELGRRLRVELPVPDRIMNDQDVVRQFQPLLAGLLHEEFWVILLNSSHHVVERTRISQGGISGTIVDYRLIVKRAVEKLAHAIILVHNHPSGNECPSEEDRSLTHQITLAASLFDITVADHIIITSGKCYSFRNHGFFTEQPQK